MKIWDKSRDSMTYADLCKEAKESGIRFESLTFRGIENDTRINAVRESLILKLDARDTRNHTRMTLVIGVISLMVAVLSLLKSFGII